MSSKFGISRKLGVVGIALAAVLPFVLSIPAAYAGVGLGVVPTFPSPVFVGQTGLHASVSVQNTSTSPQNSGSVTISDFTLVPSCGSFSTGSDCPAAQTDVGVFALSATGTGALGCSGLTFTINLIDATQGKYELVPSGPIVLGTPGSATDTCRVDFTFNVVRAPAKDALSAVPGLQTAQLVGAVGVASLDGSIGSGTGTSLTTVGADPTPPSCAVTAVRNGPPKQVDVTIQDTGSGLASVITTSSSNATVSIPAFAPFTTAPVVVTATKVDQTQGSVFTLEATDRAGNVVDCDPVLTSVIVDRGHSEAQTYTGIAHGESQITVVNNTPGLRHLEIKVNGRRFTVLRLTDGQTTTVNIASALQAGTANSITFTATGRPGGSATVVVHD